MHGCTGGWDGWLATKGTGHKYAARFPIREGARSRVWAGWDGVAMALPALAWAGRLVHGHALCVCIGVLAYGDLRCELTFASTGLLLPSCPPGTCPSRSRRRKRRRAD